MKRFLRVTIWGYLLLTGWASFAQQSTNVVDFLLTYDATTTLYTAWVVPRYSVPNANNAGQAEKGGTAQFTIKVPATFTISAITDVVGTWEKTPLRLGPGNAGQDWSGSGLNPALNYYVIGKSPSESSYGSFVSGTPVRLFTFKGNGCLGPLAVLEQGNPFTAEADKRYSLNVANSFYSLSGTPSGGNQTPLEQFKTATGNPAQCASLTASPDSETLTAGTTATVSVLANDFNNGQPASTTNVTVTVATPPATGTATVNADGTISFIPAVGFTGPVSFTYAICDIVQPTVCASALVSLTVNPVPAVLTANPDALTLTAGVTATIPVLANDFNNGQPASTTNVTVTVTQPTTGTATVNADGTISFIPAVGFTGPVSFTYAICDITQPSVCASALVSLTVNPVPAVLTANPDALTLTAGVATTISVLANDFNNGQPVSSTSVTVTISGPPASGTAIVNPDKTVSFTPAPGFSGPVSFTYTICDIIQPTVCTSARVDLTIQAAPNQSADLLITKKVSQSGSAVGDVVSFTITVQNMGPGSATGVLVTDTLLRNSTVQLQGTPTPSKGSFNSTTGLWTVGDLTANETVTFVLSVRLLSEGVVVNVASVTATGSQDPNETNNTASACTSVPYVLCSGESLTVSVPREYLNVQWYRNGGSTPVFTGNTVTIDLAGSYTVSASNGSCPIAGCCPIVIQQGTCCPPDACVPFVIKKTKSRF
jgi:uncharacterized repeat protein (TIGR01451 family)